MPVLDGISALPLLLARKPDLVVIMASTLTRRNAEISLKALSLGAADYVAKPEAGQGGLGAADYRRELIEKVRHVGRRRAAARPPIGRIGAGTTRFLRSVRDTNAAPPTLRPFGAKTPRVLLIGSSTGGPQALLSVLPHLAGAAARAPILLAQHMPATFTTILAEHIARASGRPTHEAADGEPVASGTIYVAPGGRHMRVALEGGRAVVRLDDGPPVNFCKPAVDPLFESAAAVWGARSLALILTGMGSDGTNGARAIANIGGAVIAQDEASSVIWGMPGSAVQAGLCSAVLPLSGIAAEVSRIFAGSAA
jgi:two-component system chemotaxis response regulator CheB